MSRLSDIRDRQNAIRAALLELEKIDELDDDETQTQDDLLAEHMTLEEEAGPLQEADNAARAERAKRMEEVINAARSRENREPTSSWSGLTTFSRSGRNPFEDVASVREGLVPRKDLVSRARLAIEQAAEDKGEFGFGGDRHQIHDKAEQATLRLEECQFSRNGARDPDSWNLAQHILVTGTPEYREAFEQYVQDPAGQAQRAMSLVNANGGFLLPYVLDPSIVLTNSGSANPYRRISNIKSTTSNAWQGVSSAGVTSAWLTEGTAASDNSPAVGQIQIKPQKAAAWVFGSYEVLADTDFSQQLPTLLADSRDRLEENAFAVGAGTGGVPAGVVTGATNTVNTATTLVYAVADVYATQAALPARFRASSSVAWVMNVAYINKTRVFDTAGGASFWTNLGKGQPETLLGAPIYESTSMFGGTQAVGSILAVFGDFSNYYIVDRVGVSMIYEPLIKNNSQFPTGQGGWFMFWRVGASVSDPAAFRATRGA